MIVKSRYFLLLLLALFSFNTFAQNDPLLGYWLEPAGNAKFEFVKQGNVFNGRLAWVKPGSDKGKPKTDIHNPNAKLHNTPLLGQYMFKNFVKSGNEYVNGSIYDPTSGKTYSGKIKLAGNKMYLRGYLGISLLGRTETFTRTSR